MDGVILSLGKSLLRRLLWLLLLLSAPSVWAAAYVFPGTLPSTCTGAGPSYTCTGLTLNSGDSITLNNPKPATITVNGALNLTGASINSTGVAADLTLNVTGAVTLTSSSIKGHVNSVGATLNTGSTITGNLAAGSGTITLAASTTVSGNVSCSGACNLNMQGNDISIGGTTNVGYLYNWTYYRARFGGSITANYYHIYLGYDAVVNGDVSLLANAGNYAYYIYVQDRTVINGNLSNAQTGGIQLYASSQVNGNVSITNSAGGGTGVNNNNIYLYANSRITGDARCSACQLDIQGSNTDIGGTTSVGLIGNPNNYTSFTGAQFGSLLSSPSGNTVASLTGQVLLGGSTTVNGGLYSASHLTVGNSLNVVGNVTSVGNMNLGSTVLVTGSLSSSSYISTGTGVTVQAGVSASNSVTMGNSAVVTGNVTSAGNGVNLGASSSVSGSITAGSGVTLGTSTTVGQSLSGGNGTVSLGANDSIAGNVSCTGACYLSMQGNDISIGGTTNVGYLYNWTYYRARFGGSITANYYYIYLGYDAVVNGDVSLLANAGNYGYYIYIQDRTVVTGTVSNAQSGGISHYASSTSQCTRTLTSGTISLSTGARPGGVCCASAGYGSSCSSSCVSNSSGLTMPTGCQPPYGLNGSYYNTTDLTGSVALSRRDGPVDFDWGAGSPGTGVNADNFSVRWTGNVLVPYSGWYTFQTQSDDGVRLWVNGQQLINNWTLHGPTDDTSTTVYLKAGTRYPIEMNMYEAGGGAVARLRWKRPLDTAFVAIPYGDGTQGLYPDTVSVVPDAGPIKGAVWWSRANSFSGSDGAAMATWANDADSSRNLTGSTTRPVYRNTNALNINFNPVVQFTSTTSTAAAAQYFTASSMLGNVSWNQGHFAFIGYSALEGRQARIYYESAAKPADATADGRFDVMMPWSTTQVQWGAGSCCNYNKLDYTVPSGFGSPHLFLFHKDAVNATMPGPAGQGIRMEGQSVASLADTRVFTGNGGTFNVGWNPANNSFVGVMAEGALFLGQPLSDAQARQLESYWAVKYGFTAGGAGSGTYAYLDSAASTIWASGTGHHNNVAGIGRDDLMRLDQRISRSVNSGQQITATSKATMPDGSTTVSAQDGVQFADKSFVIWGDNGLSSTSLVNVASGSLAGRSRSNRVWRLQRSGTVPAQWTVCIPDAMLPGSFLSGNLADLQLNASTASDLSVSPVSVVMTAGNCPGSGVGVTASVPGRVATLSSAQLTTLGSVSYFSVTRRLLDHLEITTSSSSGLTCAPTTYTIKACADAACTSTYTGGVSGTLTLTGSGLTVNFSGGSGAFSIPSGSSQTTVTAQITTPGTATVGVSGLSITPGNAQNVFCGLGATASASASCALPVSDSGLLLSASNSRAGHSQTLSIQAVRKSDNALQCVPAVTGAQSVKFSCAYNNPSTGYWSVLINGTGVNASANGGAVCDVAGSTRSLTFDSTGTATATLQYDDVGSVRLNASLVTGSGTSSGLVMSGNTSVVIAPFKNLRISGYPSGLIQAGQTFGYAVASLNAGGGVTPNFGREAVPETFTVNWVRNQPTGTSSVNGVFGLGTAAPVLSGSVSYSGASWDEVGRAAISARLTSGSYLGSGLSAAISTQAAWQCAGEGGTCTVPAGTTATISFDGGGAKLLYKHGVTGSQACTVANFDVDPAPGQGKSCWMVIESGVYGSQSGTLQFTPHHLDVAATAACGSFSYAGQPFGVTVTARNAAGGVTRNYDGSTNTSPNYARAITLSEATGNTQGTLSGSVAASSFLQGVGSTNAASFAFTNKLTAAQTIGLRGVDADGISSQGYLEGTMALRSGRLVMSNAFGSDKQSLQIPLQLQYWSGKSWVLNSADVCTVLPSASVVRAQSLNHNNTTASWSASVGAVSLSAGLGSVVINPPSPSGTGSVDLAINLGSSGADNSCNANRPASSGANLSWLRSRQGSCASTFDRDPSARATFGIYSPETRRSVHVRDIY